MQTKCFFHREHVWGWEQARNCKLRQQHNWQPEAQKYRWSLPYSALLCDFTMMHSERIILSCPTTLEQASMIHMQDFINMFPHGCALTMRDYY